MYIFVVIMDYNIKIKMIHGDSKDYNINIKIIL